MSIFKIHHITRYEYDRPVKESANEIKIFPYQCPEQEVLQHDLFITDHPDIQTFTDYYGNRRTDQALPRRGTDGTPDVAIAVGLDLSPQFLISVLRAI